MSGLQDAKDKRDRAKQLLGWMDKQKLTTAGLVKHREHLEQDVQRLDLLVVSLMLDER